LELFPAEESPRSHRNGNFLNRFFEIDLSAGFVIIYFRCAAAIRIFLSGGNPMATKSNFILKVQDAKLADVQKALKDANINVVSIMEIHKEEA
jgi:hypothetical protein